MLKELLDPVSEEYIDYNDSILEKDDYDQYSEVHGSWKLFFEEDESGDLD